jgi:16S rRNA G966 N2-methylase RsmD
MLKKNTLVELATEETNPYQGRPEQFEVVEADPPFHGQCGENQREYRNLLQRGEVAVNASNFADDAEVHPNVNTAKEPHTPSRKKKTRLLS